MATQSDSEENMNALSNQVADPILVSELFKMVYQWGRVGVVVDSSAPAFQEQLKQVIGSLK
jgi:hypothetical protein